MGFFKTQINADKTSVSVRDVYERVRVFLSVSSKLRSRFYARQYDKNLI